MQRSILLLLVLVLASPAQALPSQEPARPPLRTPAESAGWTDLTPPGEVREFYHELAARSPNVRIRVIGRSAEERPLLAVTIARPAVTEPWEAHQAGKPVVFIGAQVHGNEPGSSEGLMLFARDLALGPLRPLLDEAVFVFVPQINPDGAAAGESGTRANAVGYNVNRDYMRLDSPETRAVVRVITAWRPHVIVDAHELDGPPRVYDFYTFSAVNVNGPHAPARFAADQVVPAVVTALEAAGFTHQVYHRVSPVVGEVLEEGIFAGGYGAQSLSRYGGTQGAISLLFESRTERSPRGGILPGPKLEERARRHRAAMGALGRFVAEHPRQVMAAVEAGRREMRELGNEWNADDSVAVRIDHVSSGEIPYRYGEMRRTEGENDASWWEPTGRILDLQVPLIDSSVTTLARVRPVGYLIAPHRRDLADHLADHGVQVERLVQEATVEVERFRVDSVSTGPRPYEGHVPQAVWTTTIPTSTVAPAGSYLVRAGQPTAALMFHFLEPEDGNSFASGGEMILEARPGRFLPVQRLRQTPAAATLPLR